MTAQATPRRPQPRRVGGRLRPLTAADRARKQARNERRGRQPRTPAPAKPRTPITAERREQLAAAGAGGIRPLLSFVGRKRKGPRRRKATVS